MDFVVGVIKECKDDNIYYQRRTRIQSGVEYPSKQFIIESIKANEWYAPAVLNLIRTKFLTDNNLTFKTGYLFEDHEFLPRLYLAANKIVYVDFPFYNYIIRENSIMTSNERTRKKQSMSIEIYRNWFELFKDIEDLELKHYLNGVLVKYYLRNARIRDIRGWKIDGMDFNFAMQNSLNLMDRIKTLLFNFFPVVYCSIKTKK